MSTFASRYVSSRHELGLDAVVLMEGVAAGEIFDPVAAWQAIVVGSVPTTELVQDSRSEPEPRRTSAEWAVKSVLEKPIELVRAS